MQLIGCLIREPLLHFLALGVLIFALYGSGSPPPDTPASAEIVVTQLQVDRLAKQFEAGWRRPPTDAEVAALVEDWVREEVYYREALALGLDRDDAVIRRRLRQKMEFLSESSTPAVAPDETTLRAHYAAHQERFSAPSWITFRQVALDGPGEAETIRLALTGGADPRSVGRAGLLPEMMESVGVAAVNGVFGPGFFERISALPQGHWEGPVPSAYGSHLVHVIAFEPVRAPPFEAVRSAVEQDWQRLNDGAAREAQYKVLRERYQVALPQPGG